MYSLIFSSVLVYSITMFSPLRGFSEQEAALIAAIIAQYFAKCSRYFMNIKERITVELCRSAKPRALFF